MKLNQQQKILLRANGIFVLVPIGLMIVSGLCVNEYFSVQVELLEEPTHEFLIAAGI